MRKLFARAPSPAAALAFIALLAALSGSAIALPGKNTVDSADIKNGQVKGKDVGRNAVTSPKIKNGSASGADVRDNSLKGADIDESSLGQVPSANTAGSAGSANTANTANSATTAESVGGVSLRSFNYNVDNDGPATEILSFGGLTLTATCVLDVLDLSAGSTVDNAELGSYTVEADEDAQAPQNTAYSGDVDVGDSVDHVSDDEDEEVGSLRYTKPDGSGVSLEFHIWGGDSGLAGGRCAVNGVASSF
jgi:hypothetical protein